MNNPNPFIPQGSLQDQKNKKRANFKVAIYSIFGFNILLMSFFLIQGCKKEESTDTSTQTDVSMANNPPTNTDTNTAPPPLSAPSNSVSTAMSSNAVPPPPPQQAPPPPPPEPATKEYVVVKGDSFYTIAKKLGVKMKEVEAANPNIAPTKLKVGMKLEVPENATVSGDTGAATAGSDTTGGGTETYTVKPGDNLTKIAKSYGISVRKLRAANELKTDKIKVGQKLKVPEKAAPAEAPAPAPAPAAPIPAPMPGPSGPTSH